MRFVSKLLAFVVFGAIAYVIGAPLGAALGEGRVALYAALILGMVGAAVVLAPTGWRAWGRGSLIAGALALALPVTMTLLSSRAFSEVTAAAEAGTEAATAIGAGIGAGMMVAAAGFFGLFLGAIFIVLGLVLVLGGRREVVVIERSRAA